MRITTEFKSYVDPIEMDQELRSRIIKYRSTLSVLKAADISASTCNNLAKELAKKYGFDDNSILVDRT